MFYYLNGTVAHIEPYLVVIDCGGVGYACRTTSYTLSALKKGEKGKVFTHLNVREDAMELYGFSAQVERSCFRMLTQVSGVGAKVAIAILSSLTADQVAFAIMAGDSKALTAAPGVGPKLAQRIVLELKDKVAKGFVAGIDLENVAGAASDTAAAQGTGQAIAALVSLGYSQSEAALAVSKIDGTLPVEEIIKLALRSMAGRR